MKRRREKKINYSTPRIFPGLPFLPPERAPDKLAGRDRNKGAMSRDQLFSHLLRRRLPSFMASKTVACGEAMGVTRRVIDHSYVRQGTANRRRSLHSSGSSVIFLRELLGATGFPENGLPLSYQRVCDVQWCNFVCFPPVVRFRCASTSRLSAPGAHPLIRFRPVPCSIRSGPGRLFAFVSVVSRRMGPPTHPAEYESGRHLRRCI